MRAVWKRASTNWPPPFDPGLVWANPDFDYEAERVWREMHPHVPERERYYQEPRPAADVIRADWRKIRSRDLSDAEHELASHENRQLLKSLENLPIKRMPGDRSDKWRSRAAVVTPPLADIDNPKAQEWLERMGG